MPSVLTAMPTINVTLCKVGLLRMLSELLRMLSELIHQPEVGCDDGNFS